jgi:hypothetical protein
MPLSEKTLKLLAENPKAKETAKKLYRLGVKMGRLERLQTKNSTTQTPKESTPGS